MSKTSLHKIKEFFLVIIFKFLFIDFEFFLNELYEIASLIWIHSSMLSLIINASFSELFHLFSNFTMIMLYLGNLIHELYCVIEVEFFLRNLQAKIQIYFHSYLFNFFISYFNSIVDCKHRFHDISIHFLKIKLCLVKAFECIIYCKMLNGRLWVTNSSFLKRFCILVLHIISKILI